MLQQKFVSLTIRLPYNIHNSLIFTRLYRRGALKWHKNYIDHLHDNEKSSWEIPAGERDHPPPVFAFSLTDEWTSQDVNLLYFTSHIKHHRLYAGLYSRLVSPIIKSIIFIKRPGFHRLPPVSMPLEVKVQLKNVIIKLTTETMPIRTFPFAIDNFESNVFIRWPSFKSQDGKIWIVITLRLKILKGGKNHWWICSHVKKM